MENWTPPDIGPICREQNAPLTQCSTTGFMYLTLLAQLFGKSIDSVPYPRKNPYSHYNSDPSSVNSDFDLAEPFTSHPIEDVLEPTARVPLGPVSVNNNDGVESDLAVKHKTRIHSHGPDGSHGFYETTFYTKPDKHDFDFDFDKEFTNPFSKFKSKHKPSNFDFNFLNQNLFDVETADSKKISVKAEKGDKKNRSRKKRRAVEEYDFIIVGAGSAGCVIANRLSEVKKWKILLLEAGPEEPEVTSVPALAPVLGRSSIDWMYRTQPEELTCRAQRGQTCAWLSGRVMGGSSAINYLVYMRGNKKDYDEWNILGNKGWSYEEVLPYFKKSENNRDFEYIDESYHGKYGPMTVERFPYADKNVNILIEAFQETGLPLTDFNGDHQIGTMATQTTSENGKRMSTNVAFIRPIRRTRKNLVIRTNSQVTKVLIDSNKKAYGVKYIKNGLWYEAYVRKEVILSAGGLNSPKILMLSGIGPKTVLQTVKIPVIKNLKVGHNLQDHVTTDAMLIGLMNDTSTLISSKEMLNEIKNYHSSNDQYGPLSATGPVHASAFIRTEYADKDETIPDIQFHFDGRNLKEFYSDPTTYLSTNVLPFAYYNSINVRPILLAPKSRGYLTLNKTNPVLGQPLIYPRFFTVKQDLDTLVAALRFATKLENTKAFQDNGMKFIRTPVEGCLKYKWGSYKYFACLFTGYTTTIFHPSGTCKMGPSWDKDAVVDPRLKVYGIKYLRVADASIMPKIPRGNTNAPVIMIGEKLAEIIKEDWGVSSEI